ncbi:hypothetical protein NGTWS0302_17540 [Mycolicibacterium cyprinidarum]|uniref:Uncharacterized protein n=1 Tax=Mycolicibacterium cyprinidarum TaxID=2860311 RepID=A0ABQ4V9I3_9MYCO|nr:hypothetical protein NGTWS1702_04350 [Mycolicibacterium sp. NGTWSNA01]GJF13302.1 hypothetical protein NGTWS1803_24510 [Mycolicibacterium sp. NGTWS1803]GJF18946.1 hypothetical protein NGTWS0302_17540 [Mycolicibacterium sp. NGTWS0302]
MTLVIDSALLESGPDRPAPPSSLLLDVYRTCEALPVVGGLFTRGKHEAQALLSFIIAAVVDELDLTAIVRDRLHAEAIDAVIARIDLVALANEVIDGVDLPAIIRESTNSVTADVLTDVRTQGERADDAVAGFVDRVLGRKQGLHVRPG